HSKARALLIPSSASMMLLMKEPKTGYDIHSAEPLEKVFILLRLLLVSIWECLVAVVSNVIPKGWCPYKSIDGQHILITGAANGLGRLLALRFATHPDITLILWDRDDLGLKKVKEECESIGAKVHIFTVDMLKSAEIKKAALRVMKEIRRVDILINNAGIGIGGKILEISEENVRKTFEVNTLSHFWMVKEFLPDMYDRNLGHVVSIASMGGITVAPQDLTTYCCSKFASMALMEGLENESVCLGKNGLRFTTVCPAYFQTPLLNALTTKTNTSVMTPEYVADYTVDAILRELRIVVIPRVHYGIYAFKGYGSLHRIRYLITTVSGSFLDRCGHAD
ncbi:hypothetical protein PENTCL1PPCAC_2829, partial [Pristionchus entomophagus]